MKNQLIILFLLLAGLARASLTAVVQPGFQFPLDGSIAPTFQYLNELATPTVAIYGTIGGANTLTPGSVTSVSFSSSVWDNLSIGLNGNTPGGLQVLAAGVYGNGLTNSGISTLAVNIDGTLQFTRYTNGAGGIYELVGASPSWAYNTVWLPAGIWPTNQFPNAWGYTNTQTITNYFVTGNGTPTLTLTDTVPIIANQQGGSNTTANLNAVNGVLNAANSLLVATLTPNANTGTNDAISYVQLVDGNGTNYPMTVTYAFSVTNVSLASLATNLAWRINGQPGTPKFTASVVNGTNVQIYEPLAYWPRSGATVGVNFTTRSNLNFVVASANNTPLMANDLPAGTNSNMVGGNSTQFISVTGLASGGTPPYTFTWTVGVTYNSGVGVNSPYVSSSSYNTMVFGTGLNPSAHGATCTDYAALTVSDMSGQVYVVAHTSYTFTYP